MNKEEITEELLDLIMEVRMIELKQNEIMKIEMIISIEDRNKITRVIREKREEREEREDKEGKNKEEEQPNKFGLE